MGRRRGNRESHNFPRRIGIRDRRDHSRRRRTAHQVSVGNTTRIPGPARILVVEDQDDVRRMLVTALEIEGHEVDEADNAPSGLKRLQQSRYQLVLSDYAMPGGTGTWMLHEATRLGLMDESVALIITAHPDVRELADVPVISKPLDLDFFLEQVRHLLATGRPAAVAPAGPEAATPFKIELVLYVSSESPVSMQARRNLE